MPFSSHYHRHLASDAWVALRARLIAKRGRTCQRCRRPIPSWEPLQLHHKHYRTLGHERDCDVLLVCIPCHELLDARRKSFTAAGRTLKRLLHSLARSFAPKRRPPRSKRSKRPLLKLPAIFSSRKNRRPLKGKGSGRNQ